MNFTIYMLYIYIDEKYYYIIYNQYMVVYRIIMNLFSLIIIICSTSNPNPQYYPLNQ